MSVVISHELRALAPAWFACVMVPVPAIVHSKDGTVALGYFFVACAALVAYAFHQKLSGPCPHADRSALNWRRTWCSAAIALLAASVAFAAFCAMLSPPHDLVASLLGFMLIVPCLGIVPYFVIVTKQPFAALVFAVTLVACMKFLGCAIVCAVYGWDASDHGHTDLRWTQPNLLVWSFVSGTGILSVACYFMAARKWQSHESINA